MPRFQQAIGPKEDVLTIVKRLKLQWYGDVSQSTGLAKFARHGERGKKTRQTEEEVGTRKTTSRNGQAWSSPSLRGNRKTEKNGGNWL